MNSADADDPMVLALAEYRAAIIAEYDAREAWRAGAVGGPAWHAARRSRREALAKLHDALGVSDMLKVL